MSLYLDHPSDLIDHNIGFQSEKYRAKYGQIDRLCQHSWSLEGLRREMWGVSETTIVIVVAVIVHTVHHSNPS